MTAFTLEHSQAEIGLAPVADAFSGTVTSDVVSMKHHNRVKFRVFWGVGATGTITLTVEACDDVTPTNTSAVPYRYRVNANGTQGGFTSALAAGFTTTAGSNQIIDIEVAAEALLASGYSYVRLKSVEVVDSPILGGILIDLLEPRNSATTPTSALT